MIFSLLCSLLLCLVYVGETMTNSHRVRSSDVYPVNDVHFHPTTGAFLTVGGDSAFNFWDKESRNRLKAHSVPGNCSLIRGRFNCDGSLVGIAQSYDWSKGPSKYEPIAKLYIHATTQPEITLRNRGRR